LLNLEGHWKGEGLMEKYSGEVALADWWRTVFPARKKKETVWYE